MENETCQAIKTDNAGAVPVHKQCGKPTTHVGNDGHGTIMVCEDCILLIQKMVPHSAFKKL